MRRQTLEELTGEIEAIEALDAKDSSFDYDLAQCVRAVTLEIGQVANALFVLGMDRACDNLSRSASILAAVHKRMGEHGMALVKESLENSQKFNASLLGALIGDGEHRLGRVPIEKDGG